MFIKYLKKYRKHLMQKNANQMNDVKYTTKRKEFSSFVNECNPNEKIKIFNDNLDSKIKEFQLNPKNLIIVTDFDYTLTKKFSHSELNKNLYSSYCVMESSNFLSEEYKTKSKDLFDKYHPYEWDLTVDFKTRDEFIRKWFKDNLDLLLTEKFLKKNFEEMVKQAETRFFYRFGILELLNLIEKHEIPLVIISGGIYDIIEESLKLLIPHYQDLKEKKLISILANQFDFDLTTNQISGCLEPFVYTFNKGEVLIN